MDFFEALIELPAYGPGFWPGFWLYQSTDNTELDICEYPDQSPGRVDQAMHTASEGREYPVGYCSKPEH